MLTDGHQDFEAPQWSFCIDKKGAKLTQGGSDRDVEYSKMFSCRYSPPLQNIILGDVDMM